MDVFLNRLSVLVYSMLCQCLLIIFLFNFIGNNGITEELFRRDIFKIANHLPFDIIFPLSDNEVNETDIIYYLFTRKRKNFIISKLNVVNRNLPVKVLVHGWTEHYNVGWCNDTIAAYLRRGLYTIISVDWSSKGDMDYLSASRYTRPVGYKIAEFIVRLHEERHIPYKNIHLLSHSLGCHVAGFIGQGVFEKTGKKLLRITAMDPAAPVFDLITVGSEDRLSKDDAQFVDIIHTDGGVLGFRYPIGTADFFPNGGSAIQPGCSLVKTDVKYDDFFCSHASSHQFYIKSINYKSFVAKPCQSWDKYKRGACNGNKPVPFGEDVPVNVSGNFYLETAENDLVV